MQRADKKKTDYDESNEYPYDCSIHSANGKEPIESMLCSNETGSPTRISGSRIYTVF